LSIISFFEGLFGSFTRKDKPLHDHVHTHSHFHEENTSPGQNQQQDSEVDEKDTDEPDPENSGNEEINDVTNITDPATDASGDSVAVGDSG
jgi:hypothetical protein